MVFVLMLMLMVGFCWLWLAAVSIREQGWAGLRGENVPNTDTAVLLYYCRCDELQTHRSGTRIWQVGTSSHDSPVRCLLVSLTSNWPGRSAALAPKRCLGKRCLGSTDLLICIGEMCATASLSEEPNMGHGRGH